MREKGLSFSPFGDKFFQPLGKKKRPAVTTPAVSCIYDIYQVIKIMTLSFTPTLISIRPL